MSRIVLAALASLGAIMAAAACGEINPIEVPPRGTVRFQLDAPLCGTSLPVRFVVDGTVTAYDTLKINVAGGPHTSHDVDVTPGTHTVRAELFAPFNNTWLRVDGWDDKSVNVSAGQTVTDTLPFYCS